MSRFCHNKGKKEALATTTSALVLHQLFEQILYIPLVVFSFPHQPTDTVCLIPLLQKLGERPIECGPVSYTHLAAELEAEFAELNGWEAETEAGKLLQGLGLDNMLLYSQMDSLPGKDVYKRQGTLCAQR